MEEKKKLDEQKKLEEKKKLDEKKKADELKKKEEEKKKAEQVAKQKAEQKKQAEAAKKKNLQDAKKLEEDLFSDLDSDTPGTAGQQAGPGGGGDTAGYADIVAATVQRNMFIDPNNMKGKTATLKVKIAPDGLIISIGSCEGDQAICSAAIAAMNRIGTLPNPQKYKVTEYNLAILLQL